MKYVGALVKAVLSAIYWIVVGVAYYASVAGDRYPEPREPTFFETYGKGIVVVTVGTLIFSALIYLLERRKPR